MATFFYSFWIMRKKTLNNGQTSMLFISTTVTDAILV